MTKQEEITKAVDNILNKNHSLLIPGYWCEDVRNEILECLHSYIEEEKQAAYAEGVRNALTTTKKGMIWH